MFNIKNILKIIFVITFFLGLIAKYTLKSEMLSDITFVIISLIFIYFIINDK